MKTESDLSEMLRPFSNMWVAIDKEKTKVVGAGKSIEEAINEAHKNGEMDPILLRAPAEWGSFVFFAVH